MRMLIVVGFVASCASSPAPAPESASAASASASAPAPASASASAPAPAAPTTPPPTGGVVLLGDILAPKQFNPKPVIESLKPAMLDCYNQARAANPTLHGKLRLRIQVNEGGTVIGVDAEKGGTADDPALVACLGGALRQARFPKPGGVATVLAPMVFHP
jgi:pyruvate dehydrogenase E2 component (dihydrolipoamide acetyltransferase)